MHIQPYLFFDGRTEEALAFYRDKLGAKPPKIELGQVLIEMLLSPTSRKAPKNRPLVKMLERVAGLAARNPFPTMQESWERNQASGYLGGLQRRDTRRPKAKPSNS